MTSRERLLKAINFEETDRLPFDIGVDTYRIGAPRFAGSEVIHLRNQCERNIDFLAPGGGLVFAAVHNIQADVPGENFKAMWDTLKTYSNN